MPGLTDKSFRLPTCDFRLWFLLTAVFLLFSVTLLHSQKTYPDAGLWTTFTLEKPITQKLTFTLDQEMRFKENYTMLNLFYTNLGLDVKPIENLKVSFIYRTIEKWIYEEQYFSFRHRLMLDVSYRLKLGKLIFSNRGRLQAEIRDYHTSRDGRFPEWFYRHKTEFKLDLEKRISPFIYSEFRYQIRDPRNSDFDREWHRIRLAAGAEYKINELNSFGVYYLMQTEFAITTPETQYNLGLYYTLRLP